MTSSPDAEQEWERFRETFRGIKRRVLPSLAHVETDRQLGAILRAFISLDPPEASHRLARMSSHCPVCGGTPGSEERVAASIEPEYERGISVMIGVWAHPGCLAACVETPDDRGVPW